MKLIPNRVVELADQIRDSTESAGEIIDTFTQEECEELDELVFECSECGWWCDVDYKNVVNDELVCDGCNVTA